MSKTNRLIFVAVACVVLGALIGAVTNMIDGAVSPEYFRVNMNWHDVDGLWRAAIAQGIFEGAGYGVLFAAVFTLVVGIVTRGDFEFARIARFLAGIAGTVVGCWAVGGVVAIGLAILSPEFFQRAFREVPNEVGPMLRYAWVGGSIWGAMAGALMAAVLGSVNFRNSWKHARKAGFHKDD